LRSRNVSVLISRYRWGEIGEEYGSSRLTPIFTVDFKIAYEKVAHPFLVKFLRWPARQYKVFYDGTLKIKFDSAYPYSTPDVFNMSPKIQRLDVSGSHHTLGHGRLCMLSGSGDWNAGTDNACSALLVGLEWCVMHYLNFGW
jgi:hypothetical protein